MSSNENANQIMDVEEFNDFVATTKPVNQRSQVKRNLQSAQKQNNNPVIYAKTDNTFNNRPSTTTSKI